MTSTDHRIDIADSWQQRVREMRALVELAGGETSAEGIAAMLEDYGHDPDEMTEEELRDAATDIADVYALSCETYYQRGDAHPDGSDNFEPARLELALGLGGPTVIVTWDRRGSGWSDYFHSWGKLRGEDRTSWEMTSEEHELVGDFLRTFYAPELEG